MHQASSREGRFPWQKEFPVCFQEAALSHRGSFQQAHCTTTERRNYPNTVIKQALKQTHSQEKRRSQAPGLSYNEPQVLCHIDISIE